MLLIWLCECFSNIYWIPILMEIKKRIRKIIISRPKGTQQCWKYRGKEGDAHTKASQHILLFKWQQIPNATKWILLWQVELSSVRFSSVRFGVLRSGSTQSSATSYGTALTLRDFLFFLFILSFLLPLPFYICVERMKRERERESGKGMQVAIL